MPSPKQRPLRNWLFSLDFIRVLSHKDYALYSLFGFFSSNGTWIERVTIQWLMWDFTHSFVWLGLVASAEAAAFLLVMPLAGTLVDRVDRLLMVRTAQALALGVSTALAIASLIGLLTPERLLVIMTLSGIAGGLWTPSRLALVPSLVPQAALPAAIGINSTTFQLSQFIGPAIAGLLITGFGPGYAFALNSISSAAFLVVLCRLRTFDDQPLLLPQSGFAADLLAGLRYVFRDPATSKLLLMGLLLSLLVRPFRELLAGYADVVLGHGAGGLAALMSASGLGALIAAVILALRGRAEGLAAIGNAAALVGALALILLALAPGLGVALVATALISAAATAMGISFQTLLQSNVPTHLRGRVMSYWGLQARSAPAVGAALIGAAAGPFGLAAALVVAAAFFVLLWGLLLFRRSAPPPST